MRSWQADAARALLAIAGVAGITAGYVRWLHIIDATSAGLTYLLLVLFVAASSPLWVSLTVSALSALALDFFFLPPVGTFNITDRDDWIAFGAFIAVTVVASRLSAMARAREYSLRRLFDFSREALIEADTDAFRALAWHLADRFQLEYVAICLPNGEGFHRHEAGTLDSRFLPAASDLSRVADGPVEGTAGLVGYAPDVFVFVADERHPVWLMPLRRGASVMGVLAVAGRRLEAATLNALTSVVAIAVERLRLVEQRERAEVARRSVEIKSALLSSLAHDLRTPLTSASTAISNLGDASLTAAQRARQVEVARAGLDRLSRLFQNILEMARLDTGGIALDLKWVPPAEVIHAARKQVEHTLRAHVVTTVDRSGDQVVRLDPRLLATAVAHLLENAAQYSPVGSTITISDDIVSGGLSVVVEDQGPGIDPADLPHIFDRFYRGARADQQRSGTGMGLTIVRGLMLAQDGRVRAENRESGGARFSIFVPAEVRTPADEY